VAGLRPPGAAVQAGHLSPTGKGRATPAELADDLLGYLRAAAQRETG
jgi:hypothetical protein